MVVVTVLIAELSGKNWTVNGKNKKENRASLNPLLWLFFFNNESDQ